MYTTESGMARVTILTLGMPSVGIPSKRWLSNIIIFSCYGPIINSYCDLEKSSLEYFFQTEESSHLECSSYQLSLYKLQGTLSYIASTKM